MQAFALFYRLIARPLRREPVRTFLTTLAVALGVAVVLAIEMAGSAAVGSFRSSVQSLTGKADFEITQIGGVDPGVLTRLTSLPYPLDVKPRIEDYAQVGTAEHAVPLLGVDLLSEALPFAEAAGVSSTSMPQDGTEFQRPDSMWVGDGLDMKAGQRVPLQVNDSSYWFTVRGVLKKGSGDVIIMDLAPASTILGRAGKLDRILVETPPGRTIDEWESILRQALPEGVNIARQGSQTNENRRMLDAFRWNLRILSYIALVVGAFLIYNTISVSVVRRRAEIGILRALGATRGAVLAAFLGEAACFGLAGAIAGTALGRVMAEGAVKLVALTVESLYVSSTPSPIALTWPMALLGLFIGLSVALVSALGPAWEAAQVVPIESMSRGRREHEVRIRKGRNLAIAAALALLAWIASRQPAIEGKPLFGYAATLLLIAASTLAIPALASAFTQASGTILGRLFGVEALLAARSLSASLRRTAVLVGALSTAIAMMAAIGIMVGSFRETVLVWMDDRLKADLYLQPAVAPATDRHPTIDPAVIGRLRSLPEVAAVDPFRGYEINYQGWPATLGASDSQVTAQYSLRPLVSGRNLREETAQLASGDYTIVSEPFANKHHIRTGDRITLPLGNRKVSFQVIDIYYDYSSERGFIALDRKTLLKYIPDPAPSNIAVYLKPGVPLDTGHRAVEAAVAGRKVAVFSNRTLRTEAIRIFDRTFAITYALEAVAIVVAMMGVAGALLAMVIDRRREFGLLRFLGGARGQLRRIILFEAGLLGLLSNVVGLVLGGVLSLLLIFVINKQSFGWTIQLHWPVALLLGALTVVYLTTVLAGLYPARIATLLNPIEVVHEE